jgi:hypothetical protein
MNVYDLIFKKRNGGEMSEPEIEFLVKGVTDGSVPSEQAAAWLMAAFLRGLTAKEMTALTRAMTHSGERLDLSSVSAPTVDKHSTGGVGDGTSLVPWGIRAARWTNSRPSPVFGSICPPRSFAIVWCPSDAPSSARRKRWLPRTGGFTRSGTSPRRWIRSL